MANNKIGLIYYTVDTDRFQDAKIKRLKKYLGCNGYAIFEYILSEVYRTKGCFLEWDENTAFDVAEYWGLKESQVNEIVNYCSSVGLFDKELLKNESIITSKAIQTRYLEMCKRAKRTNSEIPKKYTINQNDGSLPQTSVIIGQTSGTIADSDGSLPQSKVKKSKEKEEESIVTFKFLINGIYFPFSDKAKGIFDLFIGNLILDKNRAAPSLEGQEYHVRQLIELSQRNEQKAIEILEASWAGGWKNLGIPFKNKQSENHGHKSDQDVHKPGYYDDSFASVLAGQK